MIRDSKIFCGQESAFGNAIKWAVFHVRSPCMKIHRPDTVYFNPTRKEDKRFPAFFHRFSARKRKILRVKTIGETENQNTGLP